jgi:hypothetical protein
MYRRRSVSGTKEASLDPPGLSTHNPRISKCDVISSAKGGDLDVMT